MPVLIIRPVSIRGHIHNPPHGYAIQHPKTHRLLGRGASWVMVSSYGDAISIDTLEDAKTLAKGS